MAISAALLTHSVLLRRVTGYSRERQKVCTEYTLNAVRVVPKAGKAEGTAGVASSDSAVLFVDAARSYIVAAASDDTDDDTDTDTDTDDAAASEESTEGDTGDSSSSAAATVIAPKAGDEVVFEGRLWAVMSVATVHAQGGSVHHWEATLA